MTPVTSVISDRILAIQMPLPNSQTLSIIGVYLPSTDHPVLEYTDYLIELESAISALQAEGPVVIAGDFNAHIGALTRGHSEDAPNQVGHLLFEVICRCDLYVASLSEGATGAAYTYACGPHRTIVDYCLVDCNSAGSILSCTTLHPDVLNLSDHLPITLSLEVQPSAGVAQPAPPKLNWNRAKEDNSVNLLCDTVTSFLSLVLQHPTPSSLEDLNAEIVKVSKFMMDNARNLLPTFKPKKRKSKFYHDDTLAQKCKRSKATWRAWRDEGRPRAGPLYDDLKQAKREIKSFLQQCKAKDDRKRIQQRDRMIQKAHPDRFHIPRKKIDCRKLRINGTTYTDTKDLLECWHDHFQALGQSSNIDDTNEILDSNLLFQSSFSNKDNVLDDDLTLEEIERAVRSLKNGKSGGADGLTAEHLKYGGPSILVWLKRVFNAILALEAIPPSLNSGLVTPVFKGKGRDPFNPNSYRGITVTSVIAKCFEKSTLFRLSPSITDCLHQKPVLCGWNFLHKRSAERSIGRRRLSIPMPI